MPFQFIESSKANKKECVCVCVLARVCAHLQVLQPDAETVYPRISIQDVPHQQVKGMVGQKALMSYIVLVLQKKSAHATALDSGVHEETAFYCMAQY